MKRISPYLDAAPVKRGRKVITFLLDFSICAIVSVLLYFATDSIASSSGMFKNEADSMVEKERQMNSLIEESRLDKRNSSGVLQGISLNSRVFVLSLTYSSLLENGVSESEISKNTYGGATKINSGGDDLYYYYVSFKPARIDDYAENARSSAGEAFYRQRWTKNLETNFKTTGYPYLTLESAKAIDESYRNPSFESGTKLRTQLQDRYADILGEAIDEFKISFAPYATAEAEYLSSFQNLLQKKMACAFIAYGISALALFCLVPLFAKDGRTITGLLVKTQYRAVSGNQPSIWQGLVRGLFLAIECIGVPALVLFFGASSLGTAVFSIKIFGAMPIFTLLIYSFILIMISYLVSFFTKKKRQTLSELASSMIQVEMKREE